MTHWNWFTTELPNIHYVTDFLVQKATCASLPLHIDRNQIGSSNHLFLTLNSIKIHIQEHQSHFEEHSSSASS